jgi:6-pyruvoyltetrahydropterin/6-carboxytetrahydropterin synthase
MIYLTRRERFSAAHRLFIPEWSEEQNYEVFGKCSNPNWHGHNYELFVTVKGEVNLKTGFVLNLKTLGKLIKDKVIVHLDHKNINLDCPFMDGKMSSTENLAIAIWQELEQHVASMGAKLHCVKISETENNFVEYFG